VLVIQHLPSLVALFLAKQLTEVEEATLNETEKAYIDMLFFTDSRLEFCGREVSDYARLQEIAENSLFAQPLIEDMSAEEWIELSIGELIYYAMPDVTPASGVKGSVPPLRYPPDDGQYHPGATGLSRLRRTGDRERTDEVRLPSLGQRLNGSRQDLHSGQGSVIEPYRAVF